MTARQTLVARDAVLTDANGHSMQLPAVAANLRPKQILFARLVAGGGFSYRAAAELAGYSYTSDASARNHASELASDPRIAELIRVFTAALVKSTAPAALGTLTKVMADEKAKDSDRIKAAKGLLDKAIPTVTRHETQGHLAVDHQHHVDPAVGDIEALYRRAGRTPPPHVLGPPRAPVDVIDAEFEDVSDAASGDDVWSA